MSIPDRIYTTNETKELIDKISKTNYFNLHNSNISRSDLFLFAMAIGVDTLPTPLSNKYSGGLILEKSISPQLKALMYSLYISNIEEEKLDTVTDKNIVYDLCQQYANTGFQILEDYIDTKKDEILLWEMIAELNTMYSKYFDTSKDE